MKYSEDLEIYKNKNGNYNINGQTYYLKICKECKEKCLLQKRCEYCNHKCAKIGKNHPMYGKKQSEDTKRKRSISLSGENNPMYGKNHSEEFKLRMKIKMSGINNPMYSKVHSEETKRKISNLNSGKKSGKWKGGVSKLNIPLFETYAPQIEKYEEVQKSSEGYLEVKCTYCGKWFVPKISDIYKRIYAIDGRDGGEQRLYCSKDCKYNCPIYGKTPEQLIKEDAIRAGLITLDDLTREVQPELRKMVFERDNWTCIKCSATSNLHCHHIEGILYNPIESADIDLCITFCETCHKDAHKDIGCRYSDLKCNGGK